MRRLFYKYVFVASYIFYANVDVIIMKRVNCMVSTKAKGVLILFKEKIGVSTLDEALSKLLEQFGEG